MVREKRDSNPVLLKFGVAIAISLGGIFYSFFRPKKMNSSLSTSTSPSGFSYQVDPEGIKALVEDETFNKSENQEDFSQISNSCSKSGDKAQTMLPEFEEIVNDFYVTNPRAYITPENDAETLDAYEYKLECMKKEQYEEEIKNLNNSVDILQKRVSTLESELLKYYGLKEQANTIKELQNRVKIHNTEAKLFNLKIEALQVDNKNMKAKLVDYSKTVSELEAAKEMIDLLKKKLKVETEHNKKQLLSLQERVKKMQNQELVAVSGDKSIELKVQRIKELEEEAEELRNININLRGENLELAQKLEKAQTSSLQEVQKAEALKEKTQNLKQHNGELLKQVEQLQTSWCADIEELVYLRWINACLRYEVRNYQPETGKTSSRDLSKTLSPKSEEKAKQLIMEYANKQGLEDKGKHIMDSDFDQWSFSQFSQSNPSDNSEFDDNSSFDHPSANKTDTSSKKRIFSKLRRLLRGEDENNHNNHHENNSSTEIMCFNDSPLFVFETSGNGVRRMSLGSDRYLKGLKSEELKELERKRRYSDLGLPRVSKNLVSGRVGVDDVAEYGLYGNFGLAEERSKLVKYAEVLKDSSKENLKFHRRAVSHS